MGRPWLSDAYSFNCKIRCFSSMSLGESTGPMRRRRPARSWAAAAVSATVACTVLVLVTVSPRSSWPSGLLQSARVDGCEQSEQEFAARRKAGEVARSELEIRHYFEAADTDHSGCIDADELVKMGRLLAHSTGSENCHEGNWCSIDKEKATEVIAMMDTDGNGGVSYSEVLQFVAVDNAFKKCGTWHKELHGFGLTAAELPCAVAQALKFLQLNGGSRANLSDRESEDIVALRGDAGALTLEQFNKVFSLLFVPNATPLNANRRFNSASPPRESPRREFPTSEPASPPPSLPPRPSPSAENHPFGRMPSGSSHVYSWECSKSKEDYDAKAAAGALDHDVARAYAAFRAQVGPRFLCVCVCVCVCVRACAYV